MVEISLFYFMCSNKVISLSLLHSLSHAVTSIPYYSIESPLYSIVLTNL